MFFLLIILEVSCLLKQSWTIASRQSEIRCTCLAHFFNPKLQKYKLFTFMLQNYNSISSVSSVPQWCLTLCDPMNRSTPGLPVHHQLPEFTQTHVLRVGDAIQPSHPLSSPSPPAPNPSEHQSLLQHHSSKASILQYSAFFMVQLSHPYMTTGKTISLTRWTFVGT